MNHLDIIEEQEYRYGVPITRVDWYSRRNRNLSGWLDSLDLIKVDVDWCRAFDIYVPKAGYLQYNVGMFVDNIHYRLVSFLYKNGFFPNLEPGTMFSWKYFKLRRRN